MQNKLFYIILISLLLISCNNKTNIEIQISNKEEISIGQWVDILLINNSDKSSVFALNNIDTISVSESYNLYYKIYDKTFKELRREEISIADGEFLISEDYQLMKQKKQDSLNYWRDFILPPKDTLCLTFYVKKRFYNTPLSYQVYPIGSDNIYYISFFFKYLDEKPIRSGEKPYNKVLQSNYYKLILK